MNHVAKIQHTIKHGGWPMGLALTVLALASCSDKLDQMPDNRTEIDSVDKVKQLLVSAYPESSPAVLCGLSADSYEDNNVLVPSANMSADAWQDEAFLWEDVTAYMVGMEDTPYEIWEKYYKAIAVCNHALQAIGKMDAETSDEAAQLDHYRGEALVQRAYLHFVLTNVFCMAYTDSLNSLNDKGIPYVTEPETTVSVHYERPSVTEDYAAIEQDLLAGLPYIDDAAYEVPAYHMNRAAANAFAARFYLYKRDWRRAETYATAALGADASSKLRNWKSLTGSTSESKLAWYNDESLSCNFLLECSYSVLNRMFAERYAINGTAMKVTTSGNGPCWSAPLPCYEGNLDKLSDDASFGCYLFTATEYMEFTDKIAGIGYLHQVYHPFTAEETLLCRAEARLYQGDVTGCLSDLGDWTASKLCPLALTESDIRYFYAEGRTGFVCDINPDKMGWSAADVATATTNKHLVDCILHFRHIETVYDGLRWFDVKRYGIPLKHVSREPGVYNSVTVTLDWDDPRRALQLPAEAIAAGMEPNVR